MKDNAPKIEIDSMPFEDGIYTRWRSTLKHIDYSICLNHTIM